MTEQPPSANAGLKEQARSINLLNAADEMLHNLVEHSPFGIYVVDADFRVMLVSDGAKNVFFNIQPLIGRDFADVINIIWQEPFSSDVIAIFKNALKTGEPYHAPNTVEKRRDILEIESYDWKVERIRAPDGRFCVVCHFYDLSERNHYETELHDHEQRLRLATEASAVGIWEWNLTTNEVHWDAQMFRIYGVEATEVGFLQYSDWRTFLLPDEVHHNERILQETMRQHEKTRRTFRIRRKDDGEIRYIQSMEIVRTNETGQAEWMVGTNLDVTERESAFKALRDSDERYRAAIATVSDVVWTNNAVGLMEAEQPGWENFTGQTIEDYHGYGWTKKIHPEDVQTTIDAWNKAVADKSTFDFEHRVCRHDGQWRICSVRAVPILNDDKSIREWVGVHTDITERKRDEENIRQFASELSEAHNRKDWFLATLAHELRNPLATIQNALQLMKLEQELSPIVEETHSMIERQFTQMVRLVDDLMDVNRISQGKLELRKEPISLATIINSAVETSRPLIERMDQELIITIPKKEIIVNADLTRLAQVFLNLLNNAAKYSYKQGQIWLTIEPKKSEVVVSVKDNGIGIAPDQLPLLFKMFSQLDRSLEKSQGGLGVGLTLVKRLVQMHNGNVEVNSQGLGTGSEFIVTLPILNEPGKPFETFSEETLEKSSHIILVVDDNRDGADTLSMMLRFMGNEIFTAYDGIDALEAAERIHPDVVILDIGLPRLNGYEVCSRIRQQAWGRGVVFIAVTGWAQDEDRHRSKAAGFDYHMLKPVNPKELIKLLAELKSKK